MILKKYNVILYFIILLNLVVVNVVIAQKSINTLSTATSPSPSSTTGEAKTSSTLIPSLTTSGATSSSTLTPPPSNHNITLEDCKQPCKNANDTLGKCDGTLQTPDTYIKQGHYNGTYKPESYALAKCMCNQPYYDTISECIGCFANVTNFAFSVPLLPAYKDICKKIGVPFTQQMGAPSKAKSIKFKILIVVIAVLIGLLGIAILQICRMKRRKKRQEDFAQKFASGLSGSASSDGHLSEKYPHYPPPTSTSPYVPPPEYPPPSQTDPYYPPPSSEYPPPHGGQGGHADSYYQS